MQQRAAVGVPEGSPLVVVDGVSLAVAREGHGTPLVCLHATGHGGRDFERLAAALNDRFEVVRIDWPGQGRSGHDVRPATAQRYAELLQGVLQQLGIERPILLGNSIGGAAAIVYAIRHPVRALVLCNPGGLMPVNAVTRVACALFARFFAAGARGAGWFAAAFGAYYRYLVLPSRAAAAARMRIIAAGAETAPVLQSAWTGFGRPASDLRLAAASLAVPVWFAWARQDRIIPLWRNRPAIRAIRDMTLTTYDGGHAAFLEQPEDFLRDLLRFCEQRGF